MITKYVLTTTELLLVLSNLTLASAYYNQYLQVKKQERDFKELLQLVEKLNVQISELKQEAVLQKSVTFSETSGLSSFLTPKTVGFILLSVLTAVVCKAVYTKIVTFTLFPKVPLLFNIPDLKSFLAFTPFFKKDITLDFYNGDFTFKLNLNDNEVQEVLVKHIEEEDFQPLADKLQLLNKDSLNVEIQAVDETINQGVQVYGGRMVDLNCCLPSLKAGNEDLVENSLDASSDPVVFENVSHSNIIEPGVLTIAENEPAITSAVDYLSTHLF